MKMSQRLVVGASLVLALLVVATASAQEQGRRGRGGFGFGFGRGQQSLVSLASQEPVQKDLGLSADAVSKVSSLNEEYRAAQRKEMEGISFPQNFRDLPENERAARIEEYTKKTTEATAKLNTEFTPKLKTIVGDDGLKRLKQIQLQSQGAAGLTNADVAAELKINDEQKKKLADVDAEYNTKVRALGRDGDDQERAAKQRELRTERDTKALAVLTPEQKEKYNALKGPAFDVSTLRTGFGGRRGNNN
jgi:Spy/CpxP family protein refolding chaperone